MTTPTPDELRELIAYCNGRVDSIQRSIDMCKNETGKAVFQRQKNRYKAIASALESIVLPLLVMLGKKNSCLETFHIVDQDGNDYFSILYDEDINNGIFHDVVANPDLGTALTAAMEAMTKTETGDQS